MKCLMAIALAAFGFAGITAIPVQAGENDCVFGDFRSNDACEQNRADGVNDVDPLAKTAQGGDRGDDVEGESNDEGDRAAASTAAE